MAEQVELEVKPREVLGKATKRLRKAGIIPANIFGHKEAPQAIQIDAMAFEALRRTHRTTRIISLHMPNSNRPQTALLRHVQRDPRTGKILHIDFFRVSLTERITLRIPLHFVGEAPAVKEKDGVLLHLLEALEVECTAQDIVAHIDVDVSSLVDIDDTLHARDIKLPPNYTLITDPDEAVAKVVATRAEIAEEAVEAAPAAPAAPAATPEAAAQESTGA